MLAILFDSFIENMYFTVCFSLSALWFMNLSDYLRYGKKAWIHNTFEFMSPGLSPLLLYVCFESDTLPLAREAKMPIEHMEANTMKAVFILIRNWG